MSKDIKDYLHYYIGQPCTYDDPYQRAFDLIGVVTERIIQEIRNPQLTGAVQNARPHLRHLEDISQEEMDEYNKLSSTLFSLAKGIDQIRQESATTHYLLSKGFDLWGLIEGGLAIDLKTLQPQQQ